MHIPLRMKWTIGVTATSLGAVGAFSFIAAHADIPVIAGAWGGMFVTLAMQAGRSLEKDTALKVAGGILVVLGGLATGAKVANTYFALTGVGTLPAMLANIGCNAGMTILVGRASAKVFLEAESLESWEKVVNLILIALGRGEKSSG